MGCHGTHHVGMGANDSRRRSDGRAFLFWSTTLDALKNVRENKPSSVPKFSHIRRTLCKPLHVGQDSIASSVCLILFEFLGPFRLAGSHFPQYSVIVEARACRNE